MRKSGGLAPNILNPGTLCFTRRYSNPGQTATGTQVGPSGSLKLSQKRTMFTEEKNVYRREQCSQNRTMFHREILFIMDLNLYLCLLFMCRKWLFLEVARTRSRLFTTWCFYTETEGLRWKGPEPLRSTQDCNKSAVDDFSITEFYRRDHWHDSGLHS